MQVVAPGSLRERNTLDNPRAIRPKPGQTAVDGQAVRFEMPPISSLAVTIHAARKTAEAGRGSSSPRFRP